MNIELRKGNTEMKFSDFLNYYSIKNEDSKKELKKAFEVVSRPSNIIVMLRFNEMGIAPLTAIAYELEKTIDCSNVWNRQVIGRMLTFVMLQLGYRSNSTRHRVKENLYKETYFKTGTLYIKDESIVSKYKISAKIIEL